MDETNARQTILIVDDTPANIDVLTNVLRSQYRVKAAVTGEKALAAIQESIPDMVLLDVMMPGMDGYEVCRRLKQDPRTARVPVIFVTVRDSDDDEEQGLSLGAVDYITKPINPAITLQRVSTQLAIYNQERHLEKLVQERTQQLNESRLEIIRRLGRAAEYKDNETGLHVVRMSHYARIIANRIVDNEAWSELIFQAAPMHDIGKIGIPDHILLKPGKLDEKEWKLMRKHPKIGHDIIGSHDSPLLQMAADIAMAHHEKWDGSGYPKGLAKESIPLAARIIAVADVFDALTTVRPYKTAWPVPDAVAFIQSEAGAHFDPQVVEAFTDSLPELLAIKSQYAEPSRDQRRYFAD